LETGKLGWEIREIWKFGRLGRERVGKRGGRGGGFEDCQFLRVRISAEWEEKLGFEGEGK
jgi:hypothetical protein